MLIYVYRVADVYALCAIDKIYYASYTIRKMTRKIHHMKSIYYYYIFKVPVSNFKKKNYIYSTFLIPNAYRNCINDRFNKKKKNNHKIFRCPLTSARMTRFVLNVGERENFQ